MSNPKLSLFCSYAHADEHLKDELHKHLRPLEAEGRIQFWHDRMIPPGAEWGSLIDANLRAADLILILVNPHFLASTYCTGVELALAMERHAAGAALVVPIIARPCDWRTSRFAQLQALPKNASAISSWGDQDEALADVTQGIRALTNHTYSHLNYNSQSVGIPTFTSDVLRGEAVIGGLAGFGKWFRFPYLKKGSTATKRDQMRAFLAQHGYRNGHVTIDTSDWYYDQRLKARLKQNPAADTQPYRDAYLAHIWDRATYYDGLAQKVLGRTVPHTILLHYTLINSLFLDDVLSMFESKGWQPVSSQIACRDAVFSRNPEIVPAGESLIWALAKESKRLAAGLRYPGESDEYEKEKLDRLGL